MWNFTTRDISVMLGGLLLVLILVIVLGMTLKRIESAETTKAALLTRGISANSVRCAIDGDPIACNSASREAPPLAPTPTKLAQNSTTPSGMTDAELDYQGKN